MSGWLGRASVVAFEAEEPDRYGNKCWNVYVSEPQPRAEAGGRPERRPQSPDPGDGRVSTSAAGLEAVCPPGQERGDGWRGSAYRRPPNGAARAPAADHAPFYDDSLEDIGR